MGKVLLIALNHLKLLARDKTTYFLLLALPIALTLITGLAFGGGGGSGSGIAFIVPVAAVDQDNSDLSRYIIENLEAESGISLEHYIEEEARKLVEERSASAAVIIPAGFADNLQAGLPVEITVVRADLRESPGLVEQQVSALLYRLRANIAAADVGQEAVEASWLEIFMGAAEKWHPSPAVSVNLNSVVVERDNDIPMGNRQSSPGYVVMFGMMTVITAGGVTLLAERENGTMGRLLSAPMTKLQLLLGKTLGLMASGMVQMAVMITAGRLLFNVEWGQNLPALFLLVLTLSFAATGFAMMLASLSRTRSQAEAAGVAAVLVMAMLGGTWWPVDLLPSYLQVIAKATPAGWAMQGFVDLIMRGAGLEQVILPVLVLTAFGVGFLTLGLAFFKGK